jgi:methylenetetrahydrofolate reductase (NADPH)
MSSRAEGADAVIAAGDTAAAWPADSRLATALRAGAFAVTAELVPPVAGAPEPLVAAVSPLRGVVDAVNVTDGPRAMVHMSGLAAATLMVREGIEPILQVTCRDRNRIALQADLLGASALGIRNVLMMGGDPPPEGVDAPKAVFDIGTRDLIALAARMRAGEPLPSGRKVTAPPRLFLGAADMPVDPEPGWKPDSLLHKIDAGARFVQTQLCYDIGVVRRYAAALLDAGVTERAAVLIGIGPLASARSARWMRENLYGVIVPDAVIDRLERADDEKAEGVAICAELLRQLSETPGVAGAHLMAPGNADGIPAAIDRAGLGPAHRKGG